MRSCQRRAKQKRPGRLVNSSSRPNKRQPGSHNIHQVPERCSRLSGIVALKVAGGAKHSPRFLPRKIEPAMVAPVQLGAGQ